MLTDQQLKKMRSKPPKQTDDAPAWTREPSPPAQKNFIYTLCEDRQVPDAKILEIIEINESGRLTKGVAGELIDELKKLPLKKGAKSRTGYKPTSDDVPKGHYALVVGEEPSDIRFYRVSWGTRNPNMYWVKILHGPDESDVPWPAKREVMKRIYRMGAAESMALYGREIKRCGKCHLRLTNRVSRAIGIGPICGGRMFSNWDERVYTARQALLDQGLDPDEEVA